MSLRGTLRREGIIIEDIRKRRKDIIDNGTYL